MVRLWFGLASAACGKSVLTAEEYLKQSKNPAPALCGEVVANQCSSWTPTAADQTAMSCFVTAFQNCTSARLRTSRPTAEGDPIIEDIIVEKVGADCSLRVFTDTRADKFGANTVRHDVCTQIDRDDSYCSGLVQALECTAVKAN
jgi:hypothetical protein